MESYKCPICNKKSNEPINLRCDHHPCFQCASQIITQDQESTLETRYRIVCPVCHKKTITYDLRHLIINLTEQNQDLFVTTKFINKKPEVVAKKCNNYVESEKSNVQSKRNSVQGIAISSNRHINLDCKKHSNSYLQYFCQQCCSKNDQNSFLCIQCVKNHKHRVVNINNCEQKIQSLNEKKRKQLLPTRKKMIEQIHYNLVQRKQSMDQEYENLFIDIAQEFKQLHLYLNDQFQQIKKDIKIYYARQNQQIRSSISFAEKLRESISNLEKLGVYARTQIETEVNFTICISDLELAFETGRMKFNDRYDLPTIVKRTSSILGNIDKLFEIQSQRPKQGSKLSTPNNSARMINCSFDNKNFKIDQRIDQNITNISLLKQNLYPISPKAHLTNKLNI